MSTGKNHTFLIIYCLSGFLISLLPLLGFYAHAGRHDQWFFLVLLGGWLGALAFAVASLVLLFLTAGEERTTRIALGVMAALMLVMSVVGFFGLADGFRELVAG